MNKENTFAIFSNARGSVEALSELMNVIANEASKKIFLGGALGFGGGADELITETGECDICLKSRSDEWFVSKDDDMLISSQNIKTLMEEAKSRISEKTKSDLKDRKFLSKEAGISFISDLCDLAYIKEEETVFGWHPNPIGANPSRTGIQVRSKFDGSWQATLEEGRYKIDNFVGSVISPGSLISMGSLGTGWYLLTDLKMFEVRKFHYSCVSLLEYAGSVPGVQEVFWKMLAGSAKESNT